MTDEEEVDACVKALRSAGYTVDKLATGKYRVTSFFTRITTAQGIINQVAYLRHNEEIDEEEDDL